MDKSTGLGLQAKGNLLLLAIPTTLKQPPLDSAPWVDSCGLLLFGCERAPEGRDELGPALEKACRWGRHLGVCMYLGVPPDL